MRRSKTQFMTRIPYLKRDCLTSFGFSGKQALWTFSSRNKEIMHALHERLASYYMSQGKTRLLYSQDAPTLLL